MIWSAGFQARFCASVKLVRYLKQNFCTYFPLKEKAGLEARSTLKTLIFGWTSAQGHFYHFDLEQGNNVLGIQGHQKAPLAAIDINFGELNNGLLHIHR